MEVADGPHGTARGGPARTTASSYDHELVPPCSASAGQRHGRHALEGAGRLDWSTGHLHNPCVDVTKEDDDALRLMTATVPVPVWMTSTRSRRGCCPTARPTSTSGGVYCWNSEVGAKNARPHRKLLTCARHLLPEPQPLGRRGLPGKHHPALEIPRLPLRPRRPPPRSAASPSPRPRPSSTASARRERNRRAVRGGPSGLPAEARVLEGRERGDRRVGVGEEGRPPQTSSTSCRGITRGGPVEAAAGSRLVMEGKGRRCCWRRRTDRENLLEVPPWSARPHQSEQSPQDRRLVNRRRLPNLEALNNTCLNKQFLRISARRRKMV